VQPVAALDNAGNYLHVASPATKPATQWVARPASPRLRRGMPGRIELPSPLAGSQKLRFDYYR